MLSNSLLDYSYSRQDIENMVFATNRSHKDSEEFQITGDASCNALRLSMGDHMSSIDKNISPTESIGSPPAF